MTRDDPLSETSGGVRKSTRKKKKVIVNPELECYDELERDFYDGLPDDKKQYIAELESKLQDIMEANTPLRFKILLSNLDDKIKATAIQKLATLTEFSGDYSKTMTWIEAVCKIPFFKYKNLPVNYNSSKEEIKDFLVGVKSKFDKKIYGHIDAKDHIIRLLAQWISNPNSKGMTIGIQGAMGCGKTMLVKEGICEVLGLPFAFIPLGGAGDGSYLDGHSYTYQGATWGKIVDVLMRCGAMNPVFFFDELDKVSEGWKGDEIIGKLIHLTDVTQNDKIHDQYFYEFEFDLSRCLFVFSYNDEESINPILRDRMIKIKTNGYNLKDKIEIAQNYMIERLLEEYNLKKNDIVFDDTIIKTIVDNIEDEQGVRNLKRALNDIISNINLQRMLSDTPLVLPYHVTIQDVHKFVYKHKKESRDAINMMYL